MSLKFAKAMAAAAAVAIFATAAFGQGGLQRTDEDPLYFDLGIDVRTLPQDSAGAKRYVSQQDPLTARILRATCDNYVKNPMAAEMPETITFCKALLAP
jgi:hypothetical protein